MLQHHQRRWILVDASMEPPPIGGGNLPLPAVLAGKRDGFNGAASNRRR